MRIGLTYTDKEEKHEIYVKWLMGKDGEEGVEVIRLSAEDGNLQAVRTCDGLVLSGGVDVHPALYGGSEDYVKAPQDGWKPGRDAFEAAALRMAWEEGLPVVGICRGLQLINVVCRGTLVQDLGETGDERHEAVGNADKVHPVVIERGSMLYAITGVERGTANSAHHQAIDRLGEGLNVNCRAADGTIEGIEWADPAGKPFLLGVQWHPERMFTNGLPDASLYQALRDRYFKEIKKIKAL